MQPILAWTFGLGSDALGIGEATKAVSYAKLGELAIKTVAANLQLLLLALCIILVAVSFQGAVRLVDKWIETCRNALRDDKVTAAEWALIGMQALVIVPVAGVLCYFGWYLFLASKSGLMELMK